MKVGDSYRFRVGEFNCVIVADGTFSYPHPERILFANAPRNKLEVELKDSGIDLSRWKSYDSPYPGLLIDTGRQKVLVDTGAGDFGPSTGRLVPNLRGVGVEPADIDVVILTHAHPDHIGGALDVEGRPTFPRARYVISEAEWQFWNNDPDVSALALPDDFKAALLAYASKNLPPLVEQIEYIDLDTEIVPGICAIDGAGHTPGQIAVRIASKEELLLAVADVVVHPIHLKHPDWCTAVDYARDATISTRRRILQLAATDEALVFAYHFPAPGVGRVRINGDVWQWEPVAR